MRNDFKKEKKILKEAIEKWNLNLSNLTILTEAASGNYIFTPIIAAMAGGMVYALTKDSIYSTAKEVKKETLFLAKKFNVSKNIKILENYLPEKIISEVDIITNLGFLRPIGKKIISRLKKTAAISLMWETWEFREKDLDLRLCWQRDISVLGTDESHPRLRTLDYLNKLIFKKISEIGIKKISGLKIVVLAENGFGSYIAKGFKNRGAKVFRKINNIKETRIFIIAFHEDSKIVIGKEGILTATKLKKLAPNTLIVQISGSGIISRKDLDRVGIPYIPKKTVKPHFMSWTLNDLGFLPLVELHTAGLRVGEVLTRARIKGLSRKEAEDEALKKSPAQDFSKKQKDQYAIK